MNKHYRDFISAILTLIIIAVSFFIVHRFILPLVWAATIAIATFPIYLAWQKVWGRFYRSSALSLTLMIAIVIAIPLSWLISVLIKEVHTFILYLFAINHSGSTPPMWLTRTPWIGPRLSDYWSKYLASPGSINNLLMNFHVNMRPASQLIKSVGISVANRVTILFFTLLCLFFMYRDGTKLTLQIHQIGHHILGNRWLTYAQKLPAAIRATVNGTIFVGLGVGLLMGVSYSLANLPAPALLGFITAILAMIPFGAPFIFIIVALVLMAKGNILAGVFIILWGLLVMFIADHLVKPILIGNATQLPFLAVLFGILGGVETLGLIGLFLGPVIMVLFTTLWNELHNN